MGGSGQGFWLSQLRADQYFGMVKKRISAKSQAPRLASPASGRWAQLSGYCAVEGSASGGCVPAQPPDVDRTRPLSHTGGLNSTREPVLLGPEGRDRVLQGAADGRDHGGRYGNGVWNDARITAGRLGRRGGRAHGARNTAARLGDNDRGRTRWSRSSRCRCRRQRRRSRC